MTATRTPRRAVVLLTAGSLLAGGGGLALLGTASAASACPTYTDAAGDAGPNSGAFSEPANPLDDPSSLDILSVTHRTDAGVLSAVVKVDHVTAAPGGAGPADGYQVAFTVAKKAVVLQVIRDGSNPTADPVLATKVTVGGTKTAATPKAVFDTKANTVTLSVPVADLEKDVGAPLSGQAFSAMSTKSFTAVGTTAPAPVGGNFATSVYDVATAPAAATYTVGDSCGGSAPAPVAAPAATPAGSATPAPSGSATPAPSGSATPAPSGSATPAPSGSATPAPSGSATPAPSGSATPAPSGSPTPAPSSGPSAGPSGQFDLPRKGCTDIVDPAGDADANPMLLGAVALGADPDLDILGVNFRTSPTTVSAYLHISALNAAGPAFPLSSGHQFDVLFTANKKVVDLAGQSPTVASAKVGGAAAPALKVTAQFDYKHSYVILSVDRTALATAVGAPLADGAVLTATSATSTQLNDPLPAASADSIQAPKPEQQVYTVGNIACFLPPPAKISIDADKAAQYSDRTLVYATVVDADNQPVGHAPVSAVIGGGPAVRGLTDGDGIAALAVPVLGRGSSRIAVAFPGNDIAGPATATAPITVVADGAVLTASGGHGRVSAILRDEDRPVGSPIAGQPVTFTTGGRSRTVRTDKRGAAVLSGLPAGAKVTVGYPGSRGAYLAARSVSVTA